MKLISRNGRTETPVDGKDYLTFEGQFSNDSNKHYVNGDGRAAVIADIEPTPDDPEEPEPTVEITIPDDAELVGTRHDADGLFELSQIIGEDNVAAVNSGDKVLYAKYYNFEDTNNGNVPTQWHKLIVSGNDIEAGAANIEDTDETVDYVVVRFAKDDSSDPDSLIVASSTDFGTVNGTNVIPGVYGGVAEVNNFNSFAEDEGRRTYIAVTAIQTQIDGFGSDVPSRVNRSTEYYLADN